MALKGATTNSRHNLLRKRQVNGVLILIVLILLGTIYHAGLAQIFPHGWWHIW